MGYKITDTMRLAMASWLVKDGISTDSREDLEKAQVSREDLARMCADWGIVSSQVAASQALDRTLIPARFPLGEAPRNLFFALTRLMFEGIMVGGEPEVIRWFEANRSELVELGAIKVETPTVTSESVV